MLGLEVSSRGAQIRAPCPACGNGGARALAITPSKGLAYCFSAGVGGDITFLVSHVDKCSLADAGNRLADYFKIGQKPTLPPAREKAETTRETTRAFDPAAFAEKLEYTEQVAALGITEAEALALGIGMYRGKLYQALRYEDGSTAGFSAITGELKLPSKLLPKTSNVVQLKRA